MRILLLSLLLLASLTMAQTNSKVLGQPLAVAGANAVNSPDDKVLRALSITEGKRCQITEAWAFKAANPTDYRKLVDGSYEAFKKAGWKLEPKGNLAQGSSTVEVFKLTGAKNELVLGYWLLAGNQSQLYWCRLG